MKTNIIITLVLLALVFINPMISLGALVLVVVAAILMQQSGTATINSTVAETSKIIGSTLGNVYGSAEVATLTIQEISAEHEIKRIELEMAIDQKAAPAFKEAKEAAEEKYAPTIATKKVSLEETKARLAAIKLANGIK